MVRGLQPTVAAAACFPLPGKGSMIYIESGVYVRVEEMQHGPSPRPLQSGFSADVAYRVLGIYSASESAECFFILCNDRMETWFVSNRHFRVVGVYPDAKNVLHMPLAQPDGARPPAARNAALASTLAEV